MPSTTWSVLRDQYIGPFSLTPTVETRLLGPLSRAYENLAPGHYTFASLEATLAELESAPDLGSGPVVKMEHKSGLRSLLAAAEPRVQFNEALREFEADTAAAQTILPTMGFNNMEADLLSTRLDYVDQSVRRVVSESVIFLPGSGLLAAAGPRGTLMFLQHGIRNHSSQAFPKPAAGTSFNEVQNRFLYGVGGSINRICDAAETLYEKEHQAELASYYVPPELLEPAPRE
jgi:hypothetical protein